MVLFKDGLKDNPLYVTSGDVVNGDIGPVYGVVNKQKQNKNTLLADEGNDEGQVYSKVQKSNIKGTVVDQCIFKNSNMTIYIMYSIYSFT